MKEFDPQTATTWAELAVVVAALVVTTMSLRKVAGSPLAILAAFIAICAYSVMRQVGVVVGFAAVGLLLTWSWRREATGAYSRGELFLEASYIIGGLAAYIATRALIEAQFSLAFHNAEQVVSFERSLGILSEARVQDLVIGSDFVTGLFNTFYEQGYMGITAAVLLWLFVVDRPNYRLFRNGLAASAVLALIAIEAFPVAPPRMMADAGVIDTVSALGGEPTFANQFAAIPSLHVGWTVFAGFMISRSRGDGFGRVLGVIPGAAMLLTVVVTGNHYWIDGLVGSAFCLLPAALLIAAERNNRDPRLAQETRQPVTAT